MAQLDSRIEIYQFRIWLKRVSPMIWRRLLVRSDSSIADLHHTLQIIMGWEDTYLNKFTIRCKEYGVYHIGGISFSDQSTQVKLEHLQLRMNERFTYEYNFFAHWEHEIRLERKLPINEKKRYPMCIGGKRAPPPEECGGPDRFMEWRDNHAPINKLLELSEALEQYQEGALEVEAFEEILTDLQAWKERTRFNRRTINEQLQEYVHCHHHN